MPNKNAYEIAYVPIYPYGFNLIAVTGEIPDGATNIAPTADIVRPTFDFTNNSWSSAPKSETPAVEPNAEQLAINQLGILYAQLATKINGGGDTGV